MIERYFECENCGDVSLRGTNVQECAVCRGEPTKLPESNARQINAQLPKEDRPTVVCLCGSTRFGDAFRRANLEETLAGRIVLTIGCDMRSDDEIFGKMTAEEQAHTKDALDELHLRKIDLADEILVLNIGGYTGESTQREIAYARMHQKRIRWLEPT